MTSRAADDDSLADHGPGNVRILRGPCDTAAAIIAGVMLIIVCALSTTHVMWPDDQYSDMNTLVSGENFATHGLIRLCLLPVHHIGPMTDPPSYYTHYPPLPNVVNGLMRIAGIDSLAVMRVICGLFCIAGLVFMYLAFAEDIGALAAVCGLGFAATTGYFFTYSFSVHQHAFNIFFIGVFFLFFTRAVRSEQPSVAAWVICWFALMLESLTSFEFILYPQVFAWVYVLATGQFRRRWRMLIVLATAPVAGVGLHYLQNCWALGWSAAWVDALDAFRRPGRGPAQDRWVILGRVPEFVRSHSRRLYYWSWPVLPVLAALWLALADWKRARTFTVRRAGALLLAVVAASLTWYLFMPIHTVKHPHTMSQLLPLVIIVMGGATSVTVQWLLGKQVPVHGRIVAIISALVIVLGQTQSIAGAFDRARTMRPESFYLFEAMGENALPPKTGFLTNTYADCQIAYFLRRPMWRSPSPMLPFTPESIIALQKRLPDDWKIRYYVFDTRGDRRAFTALGSNCPGRMVTLPGPRPSQALIIFDISNWLLPPEKRKPLKKEVQEAQLQWKFPTWDQPDFAQRLTEVLRKHGKI